MAGKRKTAQQGKTTKVEELPPEERWKVVTPDGQRVYYGDGVSKEEAERLAKDLVNPALVVPYLS